MKRIGIALLCLALVLSAVGCNAGTAENNERLEAGQTATDGEAAPEETAGTAGREMRQSDFTWLDARTKVNKVSDDEADMPADWTRSPDGGRYIMIELAFPDGGPSGDDATKAADALTLRDGSGNSYDMFSWTVSKIMIDVETGNIRLPDSLEVFGVYFVVPYSVPLEDLTLVLAEGQEAEIAAEAAEVTAADWTAEAAAGQAAEQAAASLEDTASSEQVETEYANPSMGDVAFSRTADGETTEAYMAYQFDADYEFYKLFLCLRSKDGTSLAYSNIVVHGDNPKAGDMLEQKFFMNELTYQLAVDDMPVGDELIYDELHEMYPDADMYMVLVLDGVFNEMICLDSWVRPW